MNDDVTRIWEKYSPQYEVDTKLIDDPEDRRIMEEQMRQDVQRNIEYVRKTDPETREYWGIRYSAALLKRCILGGIVDGTWGDSFAGWTVRVGYMLGPEVCQRIGLEVCAEMGFTPGEADEIIARTPNPPPPEEPDFSRRTE